MNFKILTKAQLRVWDDLQSGYTISKMFDSVSVQDKNHYHSYRIKEKTFNALNKFGLLQKTGSLGMMQVYIASDRLKAL